MLCAMPLDENPLLQTAALETLAAQHPGRSCTCGMGQCRSWESVPDERWPAQQVRRIGTLRPVDASVSEPTYEEFHPHQTRYDSPEAPIAPAFFPYNRCDVFSCAQCERVLLKYTEYGGYYVDHRVRALQAGLVSDAQPDSA